MNLLVFDENFEKILAHAPGLGVKILMNTLSHMTKSILIIILSRCTYEKIPFISTLRSKLTQYYS